MADPMHVSAPSAGQGTAVPDLVPARMVNEYAYCPRLFYLEWVQGEFEDNADTVQGRARHRRVDNERGGREEAVERSTTEEPIHARSVLMAAEDEGLIARIDLVEFAGNVAVPVDYKRGAVPDNTERSWEPERVQLCVQGLILRANGYRCDEGLLYYVESKTHVRVPFDDDLVSRTRALVKELRQVAAAGRIPPPLEDSPKCPRCSLVGICLPDETHLLQHTERRAGDTVPVRRLIPENDDALPLYVQEQGAHVAKSGGRLIIRKQGQVLQEARLIDVSQVCLFGNVQISSQAVRELASLGIPVVYFSFGGWLTAFTIGQPHKNVELRIHQYAAAQDTARRLQIARSMVAAKLSNCRTMLRRNHKGNPTTALDELRRLRDAAFRAASLETLLGLEGAAARVYFAHFAGMSREDLVSGWDFHNRNRRPPRDPVNALLSLMYSLLIKDAFAALLAAGFDPYLGVYHAPKYGKPALALDLAEEFRPLIADSVVLGLINNREVSVEDFVRRAGGVALTDSGRRRAIAAYERRMNTSIRHPIFGYTVSYRRILAVQARLLARTVLTEIPAYPGFVTR